MICLADIMRARWFALVDGAIFMQMFGARDRNRSAYADIESPIGQVGLVGEFLHEIVSGVVDRLQTWIVLAVMRETDKGDGRRQRLQSRSRECLETVGLRILSLLGGRLLTDSLVDSRRCDEHLTAEHSIERK